MHIYIYIWIYIYIYICVYICLCPPKIHIFSFFSSEMPDPGARGSMPCLFVPRVLLQYYYRTITVLRQYYHNTSTVLPQHCYRTTTINTTVLLRCPQRVSLDSASFPSSLCLFETPRQSGGREKRKKNKKIQENLENYALSTLFGLGTKKPTKN